MVYIYLSTNNFISIHQCSTLSPARAQPLSVKRRSETARLLPRSTHPKHLTPAVKLMSTKPWDIYAEQLLPLGYGYPLWFPEPDLATHREVHIGDVGWLSEGRLHALFNTMSAANDPINKANLMPKGLQTFRRPELFISKSDKITQQIVCSRGMSAGKVDRSTAPITLTVGAGSNSSAGLPMAPFAWKFRSEADDGAFVALRPPGYGEDIKSRLFIYDYMRKNMDSWLELANGQRGLGLDDEDIVFVCGTVKTTHWAVAAFQGEAEGYVSMVCNAPFGEVRGFLVGVADQGLTRASHHRTGSSSSVYHNHNQCLFVHYYKMKRRTLEKKPGQAPSTARPLQLPPSTGQSTNTITPGYDPVIPLLDHILDNSDADVAIASDEDFTELFRDSETFPDLDNLPRAIARLSPAVRIDEHGVGTVSSRSAH